MTAPKEGDVLAGKFRIERVLGVGGMGMVVSALHLHLEERVAIKFLLPEALANPEAVARFGREARAAVKIRSEHVARVTDVGALENGAPYMVMELLRGKDLAATLRDVGALPAPLAVEYVLQACEALAEAHALGIVHRDLKPANLFLTARADGSPCIKVLDFGISKVSASTGSGSDMGMTRTQSIMGSPLYMSPEQMASARDVDPRSDVWAVGTVLYELVTGRVPFEAETMPQLCTLILHSEPPSPRSIRPEIPEGLQAVISRCLRKDRAQRYSNVAVLARDLAAYAPDAGPRSAERISKVLSSSGMSLTDMAAVNAHSHPPGVNTAAQAWGTTHAARKSRAVWLVLSAVAAAGVGGLAIWKGMSRGPVASPDPSAAAAAGKPPQEPAASVPPLPPGLAMASATEAPPPEAVSAAVPSAAPKAPARPVGARPKPKSDKLGEPAIDPLSERN